MVRQKQVFGAQNFIDEEVAGQAVGPVAGEDEETLEAQLTRSGGGHAAVVRLDGAEREHRIGVVLHCANCWRFTPHR